jgi:hypothetical protein
MPVSYVPPILFCFKCSAIIDIETGAPLFPRLTARLSCTTGRSHSRAGDIPAVGTGSSGSRCRLTGGLIYLPY